MLDQMISNIQADHGQVRFVVYAIVNETDAREIARKLRYSGIAQLEDIGRQFDAAANVLEAERIGASTMTEGIEELPHTNRRDSRAVKILSLLVLKNSKFSSLGTTDPIARIPRT